LPLNVQLVIAAADSWLIIAPPDPLLLPENMQLFTVGVAKKFLIAPPDHEALFEANLQPPTVGEP
jgi:hypothetical protein